MQQLNCTQSKYANVFTGKSLNKGRLLVDFVPFGYDVDKLEIRLVEGYDYIDAFVIYEAPYTQTGIRKPFYFDMVRETARFRRFGPKIIYIKALEKDLAHFLPKPGAARHKYWYLEGSMRTEVIRLFNELTPQNNPLGAPLRNAVVERLQTMQAQAQAQAASRKKAKVGGGGGGVGVAGDAAVDAKAGSGAGRSMPTSNTMPKSKGQSKQEEREQAEAAYDWGDSSVLGIENDADELMNREVRSCLYWMMMFS